MRIFFFKFYHFINIWLFLIGGYILLILIFTFIFSKFPLLLLRHYKGSDLPILIVITTITVLSLVYIWNKFLIIDVGIPSNIITEIDNEFHNRRFSELHQ